uniref:C3H1-type domain-containing protein n=1 Tax=Electrophorus electricus TaxID=8005 RepID=A0AAY5F3S4_ELEEL
TKDSILLHIDNYPTEFVEYVDWSDDDDEYPRQNNRYCGFAPHFLNSGFPKPLPGLPCFKTTKRITPEVSLALRQRERRQREKLEKENADKTGNKQLMNERFAFVLSIESLGVNPFLFICFFCFVYTCEAYDENNATCVFQELDLNSCFVTNAAAIAKRKLKQKPTFERKDKKAENAKQQTGQQKSAVQPHNKEVEEEGSEEAGNDFVTKSMELAVMGNAYADMFFGFYSIGFFGNRSFCYERMQQYEKALTDAVVAVQLNSTFIKGLFRKGKALVGLKRYNEACLTYKEILKLNSSCTEAAQELMLAQIMWLMDMGFSREQSSNALIIHGTVEKALEALSGMEGKATPAYTQSLSNDGYTFAGTCLVVRYPDRIHPHLGVSTTASTNTGKVSKLPEECQFWRTAGCIKNNRCSYRHVPEHKGIDQPKAK